MRFSELVEEIDRLARTHPQPSAKNARVVFDIGGEFALEFDRAGFISTDRGIALIVTLRPPMRLKGE